MIASDATGMREARGQASRSGPRVAIAHQSVMIGDAIGNDITGAYRLLERCGYEPSIVCEFAHPDIVRRYRALPGPNAAARAKSFDLLLYHHSIFWPGGEALIAGFPGPIVVKYHNITPARFFAPYSARYERSCSEGLIQTARYAKLGAIVRWQADSAFNAGELAALGVPAEKLGVVPPFNRVDELFGERHEALYGPRGPFTAVFVGRRAPNKGHAHILRAVHAWTEIFPEMELRCRMIGGGDPELAAYDRELGELERALGIGDRIEWLDHVPDRELRDALRTAHVYLNLTEHEGFCVPLIEAQAMGLATISADVTALPDTAGAGQLVVPLPRSDEEYDVLAGLVHEICVCASLRSAMVRAGCRNVFERFTSERIANRFMIEIEPALRELHA